MYLSAMQASAQNNPNASNQSQIRTDSYDNALADLTREEWRDYTERFLPVQRDLIGLSQSDELLNQQLERNKANLNNSFQTADRSSQMTLSRMGVKNTRQGQDAKNTSISRSLKSAALNNNTRRAIGDIQENIKSGQGGSPSTLTQLGS